MSAPVVVLGGSGYAGGAVVDAAARAGCAVTAVSRTTPARPVRGVTYLERDVSQWTFTTELPSGAVVIGALAPRGAGVGTVLPFYRRVIAHAAGSASRLVVIGGHSALRPRPGGARFVETGDIDPGDAPEAAEMLGVLELLQAAGEELDWLFVSPAAAFGSSTPGEVVGRYRVGGEVALVDPYGPTQLSAPDLGLAVVELMACHV